MEAIQVVGAGGIGCAVGYALRTAGFPVTFVEANGAKVEAGNRGELKIDGRTGIAAGFIHFDDWRPLPGSWVLLCTKCYDNARVLARIQVPVRLVPIQNGFDPGLDQFAHEFEGIASFVAHCDRKSVSARITRPGELYLGRKQPGEGSCDELRDLAAALSSAGLFRVGLVPDIKPFKYTKLMYNAAISPLAAGCGLDNGKLLSLPKARRLFFTLIQENHRILSAAGIELGRVGPFHPGTVAWILRQKWLAGALAKFFEPSLRGTYCSMAGEIESGHTELDNYNGHLLRLAADTSTPAPINRAVYDLVSTMTRNRTQPSVDVLEELTSATETLGRLIRV